MAGLWLTKLKLPLTLLFIQAIFFILYGFFVEYDNDARPSWHETGRNNESGDSPKVKSMLQGYYPMFQDVHVMIFAGFGFLMTFLRRYGFTSMGLNLLLAAIIIQWSTLVSGFVHHRGEKFAVGIVSMVTSDFAAAAVLITFGALLGKTSPLQLVLISMAEVMLYSVNEYIGIVTLQVTDIGGSVFVHAFGAYFGLALSRVLYSPDVDRSTKEGSVYHSDIFALVGTVFLWTFWPSFNSILALEDAQHRAVLNTYLALSACCVVTFAVSSLVDTAGKFDMVHIQNATLAGGVAIGTSADLIIMPYGALIIGSLAGLLSVIGYKYVSPLLKSKLKIHDTCGVNNLHGLPAVLAALSAAVVVSMANQETYGMTHFPAMTPNTSDPTWSDLLSHAELKPGQGRSALEQAGFQLLALAITLAMALTGGLIVGFLIKLCPFLGQPSGERLFDDSHLWHIPESTDKGDLAFIISNVLYELERKRSSSSKAGARAPLLQSCDHGDIMLHELMSVSNETN